MASTRTRGESAPMRMMAPLPQVFSICVIARFRALRRSSLSWGVGVVSRCSAAMRVLDMGCGPRCRRPEYIPKPGLAPPGTERVFDMLQPPARQGDAVEAIHVTGPAEPVHPGPRALHELPPLGPGDRFERAAEGVAA